AWFRQDLIALFDLPHHHKITPLIAQRLPLVEARQAHELLWIRIPKGLFALHLVSAPLASLHLPLQGKAQSGAARSGHAAQDGSWGGPSGVLWGNNLGKGGWRQAEGHNASEAGDTPSLHARRCCDHARRRGFKPPSRTLFGEYGPARWGVGRQHVSDGGGYCGSLRPV